jgi:prepilin-type N-terminal cleavage/methylation domain-containing protein
MVKTNKFGFTLVELLVVVSIIGLLSGMVVISIKNVKAKARDSQRLSDMSTIVTALNMYHNDNNAYPIFDGYITNADVLSTALKNAKALTSVPKDPLDSGTYRYYYQSSDGRDFYLEYYLETNSIKERNQGKNYIVP